MILDIVIAILLFVAGALLYTFGGLRILLILFCDIPLTGKLKHRYGEKIAAGALYIRAAYTCVLWLVIIAAATTAVIIWGHDYALFGYLGGFLLTFATTIGKFRIDRNNISGYLERNRKFIFADLYPTLVEKVRRGDIAFIK